jgi:hypothetical protein
LNTYPPESVKLLGALALASIGKGSRKQLLDAAMQWPPVREMVEKMAQG